MKNLWIICAIALVLVAILVFKDKILTFGPWLIILVCPLMHFFMMKGMHSQNHAKNADHHKDKNCH